MKLEDTVLSAIEEGIKNSGSWRLRFAVAELLPELARAIGKEPTDAHLIDILELLLEDKEAEVRS